MTGKPLTFLFYFKGHEGDFWRDVLAKTFPGMDFRTADTVGDPADIDIALVWKPEPGLLASLPNLKLIYNLGAGVEALLDDTTTPKDVPIMRLIDPAMTIGMTEYIVHMVLHFHRGFDHFQKLQANKDWQEIRYPLPMDRRIGIMGLGELGGHAARRLASMDFDVAGWAQSRKELHRVEDYVGDAVFDGFLRRTDILICLLPLTDKTQGIINKDTLALLPEGAFVINAARGAHVVDEDLLAALDSGHIAGAALDVFTQEPLPKDHPYWSHDKVIVTPHIASLTPPPTAASIITNNIKRFLDGERPDCLVDPGVGY